MPQSWALAGLLHRLDILRPYTDGASDPVVRQASISDQCADGPLTDSKQVRDFLNGVDHKQRPAAG